MAGERSDLREMAGTLKDLFLDVVMTPIDNIRGEFYFETERREKPPLEALVSCASSTGFSALSSAMIGTLMGIGSLGVPGADAAELGGRALETGLTATLAAFYFFEASRGRNLHQAGYDEGSEEPILWPRTRRRNAEFAQRFGAGS